jgi:subtilisin family serine protease
MSRKFWRPLGLFVLLATLLLAGLPASHVSRASSDSVDNGEEAYIPNEVNLKLFNAADLLRTPSDSKLLAARILAENPTRVQFAEANFTAGAPEGSGFTWSVGDSWDAGFTWSVGGETQYRTQWAPDKVGLKTAHQATKGAGTIVAVLDTGVDRRHPALAGRLMLGRDFVDDDGDPSEVLPTCPPGSGATDPRACGPYGHGTHVAGLIALSAPEAKIMPLRVLDPQGVGNMWVLAEALRYAADPDGDPGTDDGADVINLSLATVNRSGLLGLILGEICSNDPAVPRDPTAPVYPRVVVVAAAGNRGTTAEMFPAAENFEGELSVAASQQDDTLAAFSERDDRVDLMAPGVGITSSVPGNGTGVWAGTSMAAPIVAGVAALVRAAAPEKDADQVKEQINETSFDTRELGNNDPPVRDRLDAAAAVAPLVVGKGNPIDDTRTFVRQHYLDFFNRAPDTAGFDHWSNEVAQCGADAACTQFRRVNTSGAFFLSIEFRATGYFVYRLHKAAFGDVAGTPVPVRYEDFMPDTQRIGEGLVVNSLGWEEKLAANRQAFLLDFVTRTGAAGGRNFATAFPAGTPAATIVDKLFQNVGVTPLADERAALVAELSANPDSAALRASVLSKVADSPLVVRREFTKAFVLMQYFGYLRRNPDGVGFDGQADPNFVGFNHWLQKLEDNGGDFHRAEMVRAFLESIEYRQRFRQ